MVLRRLAASALTLGSIGPVADNLMSEGRGDAPAVVWLALAAVVLASPLVFVRRLEPQILVRAVLWGALVAGTLVALIGDTPNPDVHALALALVYGGGLALLLLGRSGLDAPPARAAFVPVAYRGVLVAIMVMALADTATLVFWGGLVAESAHADPALLTYFFGSGALMLTALFGLYGLRVWGFLLNMIANVVVATGAWLAPDLPSAIAVCLSATAVAQLVVGLPFLRGLAAGQERLPVSPRVARGLAVAVIGALMLASTAARIAYA